MSQSEFWNMGLDINGNQFRKEPAVNINQLLEDCTLTKAKSKSCFVTKLEGDALAFWLALIDFKNNGAEVVAPRVKEKLATVFKIQVSVETVRVHLRDECAGCKAPEIHALEHS